jgi:hypothetical protein
VRRAVSAVVVLALVLPAAAAAKALMSSPAKAAVGARVTVRANGLKPGHYTLELVQEVLPGGASPTNCVGKVGTATASGGRVTITGKLPKRLGCYQGVGAVEGYETVRPGSYRLTLGVAFAPNGFSGTSSFITHKLRLT